MKPGFGVFVLPVAETDARADVEGTLQVAIGDVVLADQLGFAAAWIAEHHGTTYGGACPSGIMLLAYLAGQTSRIGLGTAVSVLPLHDPLQLAEEATMVERLSGGRVHLGVGRGFLAVDFAARRVPFGSRHELFEHGLRALREALGTSALPLWGAAATSRESIAFFADAGMGLMLNPYTRSIEEIAAAIALYRERFAAAGYGAEGARVLIHEHLFVAPTDDEASSQPRPHLLTYLDSLRSASADTGGGARTEHATGPERYEDIFPERVAFGTPETIRRRIARWLDAGVTDFAFAVRFGGIPSLYVRRSLTLFAEQVAPAFSATARVGPD